MQFRNLFLLILVLASIAYAVFPFYREDPEPQSFARMEHMALKSR